MGEMTRKLHFKPAAGVSPQLYAEGATVYEAEAEGVTYRVIGRVVDPMVGPRRTFRAYRVTGKTGHTLHPAAEGGEHRTRAAAYEQAETDLVAVLRDRRVQDVVAMPTPAPARDQQLAGRRLRGPAHAHLDAPCTDACFEAVREREERPASPPFTVKIDVSASEAGVVDYVRKLIRENAPQPAPVPPVDPATDDNVHELLDRIVRRAQYVALREVLAQLDGWIGTAQHNCVRDGHGSAAEHDDGRLCGRDFDVADFRTMVNGAADELRLPRPYRPAADDA